MIPKVVIIGRPNVGKSSLLNLLAGRRVSIVEPTAGVTRDRVATLAVLPPPLRGDPTRHIEIIDTGGYGIEDSRAFTADIERQIALGLAEAHLVLFVINAQEGVVPLDVEVAQMLRKSLGARAKKEQRGEGKHPSIPVILVANKVDGPRLDPAASEGGRLGFGQPVGISAKTGYHTGDLQQAIRDTVDWDGLGADPEPPSSGVLLAIVGKRNAGKSTLVNALAGQERVIVSEREGTTRDSVDVRFEMDGKVFTAIDTAGVRKGKSLDGDIEYYSQHRSLRSVRRADVCLLLIDSTVPVSGVDKKLGNEILKHYKPTVVVVNKWDLAEKKTDQKTYIEYLDKALKGIRFAPVAFVSAAKGQGLSELVATALSLHTQATQRVSTSELNRVMKQIMAEKTPTSSIGRRPKIYYCTQITTSPPTIGLFVNDPTMFDPSYQRFLISRLRDETPYPEVPIRLIVRGRQTAPAKKTKREPIAAEANAVFTRALEKEAAGEPTLPPEVLEGFDDDDALMDDDRDGDGETA